MYGENKNELTQDAYRYENPDVGLDAFVVTINDEKLSCANIADLIFEKISDYSDDYHVFIVDFSNVKQANEAFFFKYIKYLLSSKHKVYNWNMSLLVESAWSVCLNHFFEKFFL